MLNKLSTPPSLMDRQAVDKAASFGKNGSVPNLSLSSTPPQPVKTKGQLEAEIGAAMVQFEREYMGRGPEETRTYLIDDLVLVRLRGVLTPAERQLASSDDSGEGRGLIKRVRMQLLEKARPLLVTLVKDILHQEVVSLHTDISIKTGERIIVFSLAGPPSFVGQVSA